MTTTSALRTALMTLIASVTWPYLPVSAQTFSEQTGPANPFTGLDVEFDARPALADMDQDGDLDLVSGRYNGKFHYYENTGTLSSPVYVLVTGPGSPVNQDVGNESAVALVDIDHDGDYDLFTGGQDGFVQFFRNEGTASAANLKLRPLANPLQDDMGAGSTPTFGDWDGDGDADCVIGESDGTLNTYINTGIATSPVYAAATGLDNPFNGIDAGDFSAPALADIDNDGDLDLILGNRKGSLMYFQNTGTTSAPIYTPRTGNQNPFRTISAVRFSAPAFADIENDGDLDLVLGREDGTFSYYQNNLILPVEFISLDAAAVPSGVQLTWSTAAELNNDGFTVQRSVTGADWEALGFVSGQGTTTALSTYTWLDTQSPAGPVYYRLEQRDLDGKTSFSPVVTFMAAPSAEEMILFPNPAPADDVTLRLYSPRDGQAHIVIYDMAGRTVYTETASLTARTTHALPISLQQPAGQYLVQVTAAGITHTARLTVK
ncbi:MAG: T9SS type A sorting domain-containing protein [Bacteroidia bacterium]|nr:T9SS type A sorting domain-containing protein [Bacteroidia bacterium]